jgi:hypothetical protein
MLFPYLRCSECGWIPQGAFRRKAIQFSREYISRNRIRKEELTIILEEEAKETLRLIPEKKRDLDRGAPILSPKLSIISLGSTVMAVMFFVIGFSTSSGPLRPILIALAWIFVLITISLFVFGRRKKR